MGLDALAQGLDETSLAYVLEAQPVFDLMRRSAAQLAGLMVLAGAGVRAARDHPMLALAAAAAAEAGQRLAGIRVPGRAAHHHLHLTRARGLLQTALDAAMAPRRWNVDRLDAILAPLRAAYDELQRATAALPGFQMVALDQACCACHGGGPAGRDPASAAAIKGG